MQKQITPYIGDVPEEEILSMGCPKELLHLYRKENNPYEKKDTPPKPMYYAVEIKEKGFTEDAVPSLVMSKLFLLNLSMPI